MDRNAIEMTLSRYEPDTPPSERYNRIVRVEARYVLELRDPNSGQGGGPADKPRHQYLVAGGILWRRTLPPETVGDVRADVGAPRWEPAQTGGLVAEVLPYLGDGRIVVVGRHIAADDVEPIAIPAGPVTGAWWDVALPPCPDCGGALVWCEAGYVPGARKCMGARIGGTGDAPTYGADGGCGSMYMITTWPPSGGPRAGRRPH